MHIVDRAMVNVVDFLLEDACSQTCRQTTTFGSAAAGSHPCSENTIPLAIDGARGRGIWEQTEGCQTVLSQMGNGRKMDAGIWEIQICRLGTNGEKIFPFD